jgi:hypothetical protein
MKPATLGLAACLALGLAGTCLADLAADERFAGTSVGFELKGPYSNVTLSIAGPNGFHASAFSKSGAPTIDLKQFGDVDDGAYTYQLTASTQEQVKTRTKLDDGRGARATAELKGEAVSGTFHVTGGVIVKREAPTKSGKRDEDRK